MTEQSPAPLVNQEQAEAFIQNAIMELEGKLGEGTRIVIMAGRGAPGKWGYACCTRGDAFGVLGVLTHVGRRLTELLSSKIQ